MTEEINSVPNAEKLSFRVAKNMEDLFEMLRQMKEIVDPKTGKVTSSEEIITHIQSGDFYNIPDVFDLVETVSKLFQNETKS